MSAGSVLVRLLAARGDLRGAGVPITADALLEPLEASGCEITHEVWLAAHVVAGTAPTPANDADAELVTRIQGLIDFLDIASA